MSSFFGSKHRSQNSGGCNCPRFTANLAKHPARILCGSFISRTYCLWYWHSLHSERKPAGLSSRGLNSERGFNSLHLLHRFTSIVFPFFQMTDGNRNSNVTLCFFAHHLHNYFILMFSCHGKWEKSVGRFLESSLKVEREKNVIFRLKTRKINRCRKCRESS